MMITLPVPMKGRPGCNFSFSGLKNAFRLAVERSLLEFNLLELPEITTNNITNSITNNNNIDDKISNNRMDEKEMSIDERRIAGMKRTELRRQAKRSSESIEKSNMMKKAVARAVNVEEAGSQLPHQRKADLAASFQVITHHVFVCFYC